MNILARLNGKSGLWICLLIMAAAVAAVYGLTLEHAFHLDDEVSIIENIAIRDFPAPGAVWEKHRSRFIPYWTFALNYRIHGTSVRGYHLVNILIHALSGLAAFLLASGLLRTRSFSGHPAAGYARAIALVTALIFLCHPLQTQTVTYIVQRIAGLAGLFYLLTLLFYHKARETGSTTFRALSLLAALAAVFSKETAYTLPFAVLLYECLCSPDPQEKIRAALKRASLFLIPLGLIFAVYFLPRLIDTGLAEATRVQSHLSRTDYFLTQLNVLRTYWRLIFFPSGQNLDYDYAAAHNLIEVSVLVSLALHLTVLASAFLVRKRLPEIFFGILWFYLTLAVESSLIPIEDVIFEHRLYLPLFGPAFALTAAGARITRTEKNFLILWAPLIAALAFFAFQRNQVWRSEISLWTDVLQKSPVKTRGFNNLGRALSEAGRQDEALAIFERALEIDPEEPEVYNNLGALYAETGRPEEAIKAHRKAIELAPENPNPYFNLGHLHANLGRDEEAMHYYREALERHVTHTRALVGLGVIHHRRQEYEQAAAVYKRALEIDPRYALAYTNLGLAYRKQELPMKAADAFLRALKEDPELPTPYFHLGEIFLDRGDLENARRYISQALILDPKNAEANRSLGLIEARSGHPDKAKDQVRFLRTIGRHDLANQIVEELVKQAP